jgi:hypothetical protein
LGTSSKAWEAPAEAGTSGTPCVVLNPSGLAGTADRAEAYPLWVCLGGVAAAKAPGKHMRKGYFLPHGASCVVAWVAVLDIAGYCGLTRVLDTLHSTANCC